MTSLLYLLGCTLLAALAVFELKTTNRIARIQLYLTLLGAMAFCGAFTLLLTFAATDNGRYEALARTAALLLTTGSLFAVTHVSRRLRTTRSL